MSYIISYNLYDITYIIDLTTAIYELENSNYMIGGENVIEIISNSGLILKGNVLTVKILTTFGTDGEIFKWL